MNSNKQPFDDQYPPISGPITESTREYEIFITFPNGDYPPVVQSKRANSFRTLIDSVCYDHGRSLSHAERLHVVEYLYQPALPQHRRNPVCTYRSVPAGWERLTDDGWTPCDPYAQTQ